MLNVTILEMSYSQLNFGKNKLEILPFREALELISIFPLAQNEKKVTNWDIVVFLEC